MSITIILKFIIKYKIIDNGMLNFCTILVIEPKHNIEWLLYLVCALFSNNLMISHELF